MCGLRSRGGWNEGRRSSERGWPRRDCDRVPRRPLIFRAASIGPYAPPRVVAALAGWPLCRRQSTAINGATSANIPTEPSGITRRSASRLISSRGNSCSAAKPTPASCGRRDTFRAVETSPNPWFGTVCGAPPVVAIEHIFVLRDRRPCLRHVRGEIGALTENRTALGWDRGAGMVIALDARIWPRPRSSISIWISRPATYTVTGTTTASPRIAALGGELRF